MTLSDAERERYSCQLASPGWTEREQEELKGSTAIVVGAGGLGSAAAVYLAAAGVGRIGIVDSEAVELSGLARQPLHYTPDVGIGKADNAVVKLGALNPETEVDAYPVRVDGSNAEAIVSGADVVLDCSGSRATRYVVNDACCAEGVALVTAAWATASGRVLSIRPGRSACYRCALPTEADGTADSPGKELGGFGAVAGVVGSIQVLEAIKLLSGVGEPLTDRVLHLDARDLSQRLVATKRRAGCPACARVPAAAQSL
jgi:molybdopterin/thiamine biosynthesis adenylyltransferase